MQVLEGCTRNSVQVQECMMTSLPQTQLMMLSLCALGDLDRDRFCRFSKLINMLVAQATGKGPVISHPLFHSPPLVCSWIDNTVNKM